MTRLADHGFGLVAAISDHDTLPGSKSAMAEAAVPETAPEAPLAKTSVPKTPVAEAVMALEADLLNGGGCPAL
ncbi:MAG: hypothetical protein AAFU49_16320 [Pseudomonadota bacterium]